MTTEPRDMTTEERIAHAFRTVSVKLEAAIEQRKTNRLWADDLVETLILLAEELEPEHFGGTESVRAVEQEEA